MRYLIAALLLLACTEPPQMAEMYAADVQASQSEYGMPTEWTEWMLARHAEWSDAYEIGRSGKTEWRLDVVYERPDRYTWASPDEHWVALEVALELAYPGWDFTVGSGIQNPDRTLHMGHAGRSESSGTHAYMAWDGIVVHEFGHTVGLRHHYEMRDGRAVATPDSHPPGERDCAMGRTGVAMGSTEQFLLGIGPSDIPALGRALQNLNSHQIAP